MAADDRSGGATVLRMILGRQLQELREKAGLTHEQAAEAIYASAWTVRRMERAEGGLKPLAVKGLLVAYGVTDVREIDTFLALAREASKRGWWHSYTDVLPSTFRTYVGLEEAASLIRGYEPEFVPGLLQTEDYARALFRAALPSIGGDAVERRVKVRMARQELLVNRPPAVLREGSPRTADRKPVQRPRPLDLWAIFDESVLHREIGGGDVLHGQLKRLLQAAELPNVTVQILPFSAGAHPGMVGSFTVIKFPADDDPDVVYVEGVTGDIFAESEDARWYNVVFDHLLANALSPSESLDRVARAVEELT
jgi:hypothetical protein